MEYSPEDTRKIGALLHAFRALIRNQTDFDILHSDKSGYIYLTTGTSGRYIAEQIESPAQLADILIAETISDVVRMYRPGGGRGKVTQDEWLDILLRIAMCKEALEEEVQHDLIDALSRYRAVMVDDQSLKNKG